MAPKDLATIIIEGRLANFLTDVFVPWYQQQRGSDWNYSRVDTRLICLRIPIADLDRVRTNFEARGENTLDFWRALMPPRSTSLVGDIMLGPHYEREVLARDLAGPTHTKLVGPRRRHVR